MLLVAMKSKYLSLSRYTKYKLSLYVQMLLANDIIQDVSPSIAKG